MGLGKNISAITGRNVQVINSGVGGFNTCQSYIHLIAYIDRLRLHLVVFFHAKFDLTQFYFRALDPQKAHPDYSNPMRSLNFKQMSKFINQLTGWSATARLWAAWKLSSESMGIGYVYELDRGLAYDPDYLFDKMHFTHKRNVQVAESLAQFSLESPLPRPVCDEAARS